MNHDCIKQRCSPPKIINEIYKRLQYEESSIKNSTVNNILQLLDGHEKYMYKQIIAQGNYQLFREVTKYDTLSIVKKLIEIANECRNLEAMLRANDDEAFKNSIFHKHYSIGSEILNSIKDLKNNPDITYFYAKQTQLAINNEVLKVINKLPNSGSLEFTLEDYKVIQSQNDPSSSERARIENYSISINDGNQVEDYSVSSAKRFTTKLSTFSFKSIAGITSSLPAINFILSNDIGKVTLNIFEEDPKDGVSYLVTMLNPLPESNSSVLPPWLLCCNNSPALVSLWGNSATEENV